MLEICCQCWKWDQNWKYLPVLKLQFWNQVANCKAMLPSRKLYFRFGKYSVYDGKYADNDENAAYSENRCLYWKYAANSENMLPILKIWCLCWIFAAYSENLLSTLKLCCLFWKSSAYSENLLPNLKICCLFWKSAVYSENMMPILKICCLFWKSPPYSENLLPILKNAATSEESCRFLTMLHIY